MAFEQLKKRAAELVATNGMDAVMRCKTKEIAQLTKALNDLVGALLPTDANYLDLKDAHAAYSSCQKYSNSDTQVTLWAGKVLQLCQLHDGDAVTPMPEKHSLDKVMPHEPGKLARDTAEANAALAEKHAEEARVAREAEQQSIGQEQDAQNELTETE